MMRVTLLLLVAQGDALRRAAIVTGGTRGIGRGIAEALAEAQFDLLVTYNSDSEAAEEAASALRAAHGCTVECVGGDISLTGAATPQTNPPAPNCPPPAPAPAPPATRDEIFARYDATFKESHELGAVVHNAGQYVGITSTNADGLKGGKPVGFGDGSLLEDGATNLATMHYYQRMCGAGRQKSPLSTWPAVVMCVKRACTGGLLHPGRAAVRCWRPAAGCVMCRRVLPASTTTPRATLTKALLTMARDAMTTQVRRRLRRPLRARPPADGRGVGRRLADWYLVARLHHAGKGQG